MFNVTCELSQPMGKTEFSSTDKSRTNSVSSVRKLWLTLLHSERPKLHRVLAVLSAIGLNPF